MLLFKLLISLKQHGLIYISFQNSPHTRLCTMQWIIRHMVTALVPAPLHTHTSVGAVQKLWVWICVVFMCRWGLFKMYLEKHVLGVEKITLRLFQQKAPFWEWGASFGIFTFNFSTALCQVNAPLMHLAAYSVHPSCPQGLYTLWLVFVSPCHAAELRVNLTAPAGQNRAQRSCLFVWHWGGWKRGMPTLPHVPNTSVSKLSALCTEGDVNTQLFWGLLCRR